MPNGTELGVGVERVGSLEALMEQTNTLSIHAPLTPETRGMISRAMLERMPKGGVVVNTARGPIVDVDALAELLKRGHLAGVGLDVLPIEPPVEPIPELLRAYRAREAWCEGRLIITPHSAFFTPEAWADTRLKAAETMRAALVGPRPQNVITPEIIFANNFLMGLCPRENGLSLCGVRQCADTGRRHRPVNGHPSRPSAEENPHALKGRKRTDHPHRPRNADGQCDATLLGPGMPVA